ncbi:MAG TPA: thiamine pyrophosphate-binding protein [Myxococcota bacterium]|nr:thiamine pyrophosphate-binding protein [Myxococcota bacterium]
MSALDGGELVARALAREGVRAVFGLGGGHIDPTWRALKRHGMRLVDLRHEAAAAYCAEGWALATGEPGVCLVTAGPGLTNALTGIATAFIQGSPLVAIAGSATLRGYDSGEVEQLEQLEVVRPVTKWARRIHHLDRIPEYVALAFREATSGRPGPVYLELAIDLIHSRIDESEVEWPAALPRNARAHQPAQEQIEQAARLLAQAERPALVAGSGVFWSGAGAELLRLVERGLPLATRRAGRGSVPDDHPNVFGRDWQDLVFQADTLLVVGTQLDSFFGYGRFPHLQKRIQIDVNPAELGRNRTPLDVGIAADARASLRLLADALPALDTRAWLARLRTHAAARDAARDALAKSDAIPIHPLRLCAEVNRRVGADDTVVGDGANMMMWVDASTRALRPGCVTSMGALGTIGHGIGYALAGALARPGTRGVWLVGDGSFGFHAMELDSAARHGVPLVAVVMNNRGWSHDWVPLGVRHYERMAGAFDGSGFFVERPDEIGPALDAALGSGKPAIVNVMLDPAAEWFAGRFLG